MHCQAEKREIAKNVARRKVCQHVRCAENKESFISHHQKKKNACKSLKSKSNRLPSHENDNGGDESCQKYKASEGTQRDD